jgi:hypothetical protein
MAFMHPVFLSNVEAPPQLWDVLPELSMVTEFFELEAKRFGDLTSEELRRLNEAQTRLVNMYPMLRRLAHAS